MFQMVGMKIEKRRPGKYFPCMTFASQLKLWVYQFAYWKSFDEKKPSFKTGNWKLCSDCWNPLFQKRKKRK